MTYMQEGELIIIRVADYLNISVDGILGKTSVGTVVEARTIAIYMVYQAMCPGCVKLGHMFNKSHSNVLYHIKTALDRRKVDRDYRKKLDMVWRHLTVMQYLDIAKNSVNQEFILPSCVV